VRGDVGGVDETHFIAAEGKAALGPRAVRVPVTTDAQDQIPVGVEDRDAEKLGSSRSRVNGCR
jgi:hypothetical protein